MTATIDAGTTLAAVVTAHPELARTLESLQLDYCCHGERGLAAACAERGLDVGAVLDELQGAAGEPAVPEWSTLDAAELAEHLEQTHHRFLWDELPRLSSLGAKVRSVHGERHPELDRVVRLLDELRADLEAHLMKEERVLFPMIRSLAAGGSAAGHGGTVVAPIRVMWAEHDHAGEVLAALRSTTDGYRPPDDACESYRQFLSGLAALEADLHLHIMKENSHLFPKAVALEATPGPSPR